MKYLLDTVTVIRHFANTGNIGHTARTLLAESGNQFCISVISLMEILYLAEKRRIKINLSQTIERIKSQPSFQIVALTEDILKIAENVHFRELHDRLIIATAKWLKAPIITSDTEMKQLKNIKVIWD